MHGHIGDMVVSDRLLNFSSIDIRIKNFVFRKAEFLILVA